jgi:tetratricopeptide (TPR) repeat protein
MGMIQGNVFGSYTGDTGGAMASFRKGLGVLRNLGSSPQVELERMVLLQRIGNLLHYTGHLPESYLRFEQAVSIGSALHDLSPHDEAVSRALAQVYDDYSSAQREGMLTGKGIETESRAVGLLKGLLAAHPGDRSIRASVANALSGLGALQTNFSRLETARSDYQEAAAEWDELCRSDPNNMDFQRHRMLAYGHIGDVLGNPSYPNLGDQAGAAAAYRIMLATARQIYEGNPADQGAIIDYGMALTRAAVLPGQTPDARIDLFRKSIAVLGEAAARDPRNTIIRVNVASVHEQLGDLLAAKSQPAGAREEYRAGLAIAGANLGGILPFQRIFITVSRQLALDAARSGDAGLALNYGSRAVTVGDRAAAGPNATVPGRTLAPRAYAAMGDVYEALKKPAEARRWRERSLAALQEIQNLPGFTGYHRELMQRVQEALKRK